VDVDLGLGDINELVPEGLERGTSDAFNGNALLVKAATWGNFSYDEQTLADLHRTIEAIYVINATEERSPEVMPLYDFSALVAIKGCGAQELPSYYVDPFEHSHWYAQTYIPNVYVDVLHPGIWIVNQDSRKAEDILVFYWEPKHAVYYNYERGFGLGYSGCKTDPITIYEQALEEISSLPFSEHIGDRDPFWSVACNRIFEDLLRDGSAESADIEERLNWEIFKFWNPEEAAKRVAKADEEAGYYEDAEYYENSQYEEETGYDQEPENECGA
jgi:hypothetical protein